MRRSDITLKILKELYCKKLFSKKEIALIMRCDSTTVSKKLIKFGIPIRDQKEAVRIVMQRKIIKISKSKLKNLYLEEKLSISEIAKKLNYCQETITRELKRHKIPCRTKSDIVKLSRNKNKIKKSLLTKLYWQKKLTPKQIGAKLQKHPETIRKLMREYRIKRRTASETLTHYPKFDFSGDLEEKAYLIGFRIGDLRVQLSLSRNLIFADCTSTKIEQLKLFKDLFKKYGHIWVGKPRIDGNRVFLVRLNKTFNFLLPKKDFIPRWIIKNDDLFIAFLAGYTDAEGSFWINNQNIGCFKIASYDKNIIKQIHGQLFKMGTQCNPPRIHVKEGFKKSNGQTYKKDEWCLNLNKKSELFKLTQILKAKLKHPKRLRDLLKVRSNILSRI